MVIRIQTTLTEVRKDLLENGEKYAGAKGIQKLVDKWFSGRDVGIKFLGVLEDKSPSHCHSAILQKAKDPSDEDFRIAKIYTNVLIRKSIFFVYSSSPYVDSSSITTGLANAKIMVSDFMAANK